MTGRTIPVTRTDGSEVASEATQALIHDQLDLKSSEVVADLRGTGDKTLTDLWDELASTLAVSDSASHTTLASIDGGIGGATAAAAGDTGASTTNGFLRWLRDFWLGLKGIKTAANSLSMAQASDNVFIVGGGSADGVAPTSNAVRVSGVDAGGLKRTFATDTSGYQYAKQLPVTVQPFSLGSLNAFQNVSVPDGYNSWSVCIDAAAVFSATVQFRYTTKVSPTSSDWITVLMPRQDVTYAVSNVALSAGVTVEGPIPSGATYVQVYVLAYTSGTVTGVMAISPRVATTPSVIWAAPYPSNSTIGFIRSAGTWYDDTSAALTSGSTFTSTSRDIPATASASTFTGVTAAKEFRVLVEQDVTFTLQIQASRDNSTFRIVESITAASVPGGGFVASASIAPAWRYYRYAIVNGGTNAARTTGGSILMAN